ncbi:ABC transporter permease subunit [Paraburkholderia sp. EG286B]|uniref:ABC transporter permease subunit n=1 Tax=Paraburkholderia sp. EG286B TaxID=3237011 RepID=UPI0034D30771
MKVQAEHYPMRRPSAIRWFAQFCQDNRYLLLVTPAALVLLAFFVTPLAGSIVGSVRGSAFDLSGYKDALTDPLYFKVFTRTIEIAGVVTALCLLLGYPIAYFMTTLSKRALGAFSFFVLVPLFTPFLIRTYGWMAILGRAGALNKLLLSFGIISTPLKITGTSVAVYIGMVHVLLPVGVFVMYATMRQADRMLVSAAGVLGANPVQTFLRVYLPLTTPGIISAGVLVFIMALGFYIAPVLLGGPADTMIAQLIVTQVTTLLNLQFGYALSVILLIATLAIVAASNLVVPLEQMWSIQVTSRKPFPFAKKDNAGRIPQKRLTTVLERFFNITLGRPRWLLSAMLRSYIVLAAAFLIIPLVVIYVLSFSSSPFLVFPPPGFSMKWYVRFFTDSQWQDALLMSAKLASAAATVSVVIGTAAAFGIVRGNFRMKRSVLLFMITPLLVPVIVVALSLYVAMSKIDMLGTFVGLVAGHMVLTVPYAIIVLIAAVRAIDLNLEYAAATLGAKTPIILRKVVLPLLAPALGTAWLMCFVTSLDELLIALFLLGRQTETLPIHMWSDIRIQVDPVMSAAASIIVTGVAILILLSQFKSSSSTKVNVPKE